MSTFFCLSFVNEDLKKRDRLDYFEEPQFDNQSLQLLAEPVMLVTNHLISVLSDAVGRMSKLGLASWFINKAWLSRVWLFKVYICVKIDWVAKAMGKRLIFI